MKGPSSSFHQQTRAINPNNYDCLVKICEELNIDPKAALATPD